MLDLKRLREEHAGLAVIAGRLSEMIAQNEPPPSRELYEIRRQLASGLIRHLKSEDSVLYPALLRSTDEYAVLTARTFSASMGGLAREFKTFSRRWTADAIASNWKGFQAETFEILRALTLRISREERDLYPLVDPVTRAAAGLIHFPTMALDRRQHRQPDFLPEASKAL